MPEDCTMPLPTRRAVLGAAALALPLARARAAEPLHYATWSAAVDQVRTHLAAFETASGTAVEYANSP